jgi:hypothetical protein
MISLKKWKLEGRLIRDFYRFFHQTNSKFAYFLQLAVMEKLAKAKIEHFNFELLI